MRGWTVDCHRCESKSLARYFGRIEQSYYLQGKAAKPLTNFAAFPMIVAFTGVSLAAKKRDTFPEKTYGGKGFANARTSRNFLKKIGKSRKN